MPGRLGSSLLFAAPTHLAPPSECGRSFTHVKFVEWVTMSMITKMMMMMITRDNDKNDD